MANQTETPSPTALLEVYENQRRFPVVGWSDSKLLPSDRYKWSNRSGTRELKRDDATIVPKGYALKEEFGWRVEPLKDSPGDAQGWEYALDFPRQFGPRESFNTWVRRRRWVRPAFRKADDGADASPSQSMEGAASIAPTSVERAIGITAAASFEAEPVNAPAVKPKSTEELLLEQWASVKGSRCGSACLRISNLIVTQASPISVQVSHSTHDFTSREFPLKSALTTHTDANYEVCFLVADDTVPVIITPFYQNHHRFGEAAFSLRAAHLLPSLMSFERHIVQGVYTEDGSATLPLYPRPVDNADPHHRKEREAGQLGSVDVHWSFTLRTANEFDTCGHCGKVPVMCTCPTPSDPLENLVASMTRMTADAAAAAPVQNASDAHADKRGRLVFRVQNAEGLVSSTAHFRPYVKLSYVDDAFEPHTVETAPQAGEDPVYGETFVLDIGDFNRGVTLEVWDHCTFGKDDVFGTAEVITPKILEDLQKGSGVATLGLKGTRDGLPAPVGIVTATITWLPYTL
jgi:hypothetical protein